MADVFISYASNDRPFARRLADALEAHGWSVWWDHENLHGGDHFGPVIKRAIHEATVVVVVWSKIAVESPWVHDEAKLALKERELVPLRIDMIDPPMGFGGIHTIDLASWTGETDAEPFERLVRTLGRYLGPPMPPDRPKHPSIPAVPVGADEHGPPPRVGRKRVGQYLAAVAVAVGVAVGVVWGVGAWEKETDGAAAKAAYDRGDYATALNLARPATERGDRVAQNILGILYDTGRGVPQDYAEALRWYRRAADQGYAAAQYNLGWLYDTGQGVSQDYAEAARWYRKAADQGEATAQHNLGLLYQDGRGVPRDKVQARAWMQKAAAAGNDDAKKWLARN